MTGDGVEGGNFNNFRFYLDFEPATLTPAPVLPPGGLVYQAPAVTNRAISHNTVDFAPNPDADSFLLNADAGQTLSVFVDTTTAGLQSRVEVLNPSGVVIASATATAAGADVTLQTVALTVGGAYTVRVSGVGGTLGTYTLRRDPQRGPGGGSERRADERHAGRAQSIDGCSSVWPRTRAAGLYWAGNAAAPTVPLTTYNFEGGLQGWTINNNVLGTGPAAGLWHLSTRRGGDANHSATTSFYYGSETTGNYDTGAHNSGAIISPSFVVPAGAGVAFKYFLDTEGGTSFDQARLQVSNNGGTTWTALLGPLAESGTFTASSASLAAFAGQTVQIRFLFDTVDGDSNAFEGWYIDDVQLTTPGAWTDYYSFTGAAGQTASLALKYLTGSGATLTLEDAAGTTLATSTGGADELRTGHRQLRSAGRRHLLRPGDRNGGRDLQPRGHRERRI